MQLQDLQSCWVLERCFSTRLTLNSTLNKCGVLQGLEGQELSLDGSGAVLGRGSVIVIEQNDNKGAVHQIYAVQACRTVQALLFCEALIFVVDQRGRLGESALVVVVMATPGSLIVQRTRSSSDSLSWTISFIQQIVLKWFSIYLISFPAFKHTLPALAKTHSASYCM